MRPRLRVRRDRLASLFFRSAGCDALISGGLCLTEEVWWEGDVGVMVERGTLSRLGRVATSTTNSLE